MTFLSSAYSIKILWYLSFVLIKCTNIWVRCFSLIRFLAKDTLVNQLLPIIFLFVAQTASTNHITISSCVTCSVRSFRLCTKALTYATSSPHLFLNNHLEFGPDCIVIIVVCTILIALRHLLLKDCM
jgi:hypothetical protein